MRICLLADIAVLSAGVAMAQGPGLPLTRVIGVVGIGSGQTAHLNVFNPGAGAPLLGVRCQSTFEIIDIATGNTIAVLTESTLRPPVPPAATTPTEKRPD